MQNIMYTNGPWLPFNQKSILKRVARLKSIAISQNVFLDSFWREALRIGTAQRNQLWPRPTDKKHGRPWRRQFDQLPPHSSLPPSHRLLVNQNGGPDVRRARAMPHVSRQSGGGRCYENVDITFRPFGDWSNT